MRHRRTIIVYSNRISLMQPSIENEDFLTLKPKQIATIRRSYALTQKLFAELIGISMRTLQNWEIGHRKPCGPALALLDIAEKNPQAFLKKRKKIKCSKEIAEKLLKTLY